MAGFFILIAIIVIVLFPELLAILIAFWLLFMMTAAVFVKWVFGFPTEISVGDRKYIYRWFWRMK